MMVLDIGWIAVGGRDAEAFLQGQLSNDVSRLDGNHWQLAVYCSPQGKVLALLWVWRRDDVIYLGLPISLLPMILKRLRMFVLRSAVSLNVVDMPTTAVVAVGGSSLPPRSLQRMDGDAVLLTGFGQADILVGYIPDTAMTAAQWRAARIRAGLAQIYVETSDVFLPQALGVDKAGGVSFTKGCYVGQENIARLHYKSQTRRHLAVAACAAAVEVACGAPLHHLEQRGGMVLDCGCDASGTVVQAVLPERLLGQPLQLDGCTEVLYFTRQYEAE